MGTNARMGLMRARRVVIKVGTAVVTRPEGGLALGRLGALVEQIARLRQEGREVILVSSGAVGLGAERLGFPERPRALVDRQACAAAGQGALIGLYASFFERVGLKCAQVLLTEYDFHQRPRYVNLAATLQRLLELGAVPIINENDAVAADEIAFRRGRVFGDNDRLSALVAAGLQCDALVLLSDVDAVYTAPPTDPDARRLASWPEHGDPIRFGGLSAGGRGGMPAKVEAAQLAARGGVEAVIASGYQTDTLARLFAGEEVGTWFAPRARLEGLGQWLAFASVPEARVRVDEATRERLLGGEPLRGGDVQRVQGSFQAGQVVSVEWDGEEFARGLVSCGSHELPGAAVVVAADAMVILVGGDAGGTR